jgi:hypothetical protein
MRASGFVCVLALVLTLLSACEVLVLPLLYAGLDRSDQALGKIHGVSAWLDPALEPLAGCSALNGVWSNHGNRFVGGGVVGEVVQYVFADTFGLAKGLPDTVFADTVELQFDDTNGLTVRISDSGQEVASVNIEAKNVSCNDPQYATVNYEGQQTLSVDASGALWADGTRYQQPGAKVCRKVGLHGYSAPNGMATVINGGGVILMDPAGFAQKIMTRDMMGVRVPVSEIFLLPAEHVLPFMVKFQAPSIWTVPYPPAFSQIEATLESCHVYALMGDNPSNFKATVSLVDLGENFTWYSPRECHPPRFRDPRMGRAGISYVTFDGSALTVPEFCFSSNTLPVPTSKGIEAMKTRVIPVSVQQTFLMDLEDGSQKSLQQ